MESVFITTRKQRIIREMRDYMMIAHINRGPVSEQLGIGGSPALAEDSMVARDCMIRS